MGARRTSRLIASAVAVATFSSITVVPSAVAADDTTFVEEKTTDDTVSLNGIEFDENGKLRTRDTQANILKGCTRTTLMELIKEHGVELPELDLGGGFGIAYLPSDAPLEPADMARATLLFIHGGYWKAFYKEKTGCCSEKTRRVNCM